MTIDQKKLKEMGLFIDLRAKESVWAVLLAIAVMLMIFVCCASGPGGG